MASSIDSTFNNAVTNKDIPGAVLAASNTGGSHKFLKTFGFSTLRTDDGTDRSMTPDTLFWLGSCTKLLTVIAALQCVQKRHFTLDEDVTRLLPELKDIQVRQPPQDGASEPKFSKTTKIITLRHLLTHTSGLSYTKFGDLTLPLIDRCLSPLNFEPGEGFIYGTGVDFAGFMVERVSGLTLEAYLRKNIGEPLGIKSICFRPADYPALREKLADVSIRKDKAGPVEWTPATIWPLDTEGDSGGSGAYATIADFHKVLHSITANDGVLLHSDMAEELFRPNMDPVVRQAVMKALEDENRNNIYGGLPKGTQVAYAIGGMVVLEDLPGRRPKGALHWGGLLNVFFWMDRTNGFCGIYGSQVFPAGDPKCLALFAEFERRTYDICYAAADYK
ncbi:beta-lactamase/transpeptidase-like protein [Emericellopsis atlantica]|uniref:Beta-lactamase/transpeptidase-like protein n=1 Tax=Emericellopsis atlantica TaxID=2614577 RepID=A0A9P7ZUD7_9HYPO|nr:beta-lactamase/transpeptidase-like protein [Emericellopsis atlantica]KAG9258504.1 beta-lactamase/transpeptidase-like protein [Emericellopsis atlantica]